MLDLASSTAASPAMSASGECLAVGRLYSRTLTVPLRGPELWRKRPVTGVPCRIKSCRLGRPYLALALQHRQNLIHDAILLGLLCGEELVPLDVPADLILVLAGVRGKHLLHRGAHPQDLIGLDLQVAGLAVAALDGGLVDQDATWRSRPMRSCGCAPRWRRCLPRTPARTRIRSAGTSSGTSSSPQRRPRSMASWMRF